MGSKGALSVGRSDTAEESYIVTPRTVGDIPGTTRRDSLWSRERRVSCSAIAEHGITKGRQRYTDCYAAIPLAYIAGAQICYMRRNLVTCRRDSSWSSRRCCRDEVAGEIGEGGSCMGSNCG